jgi:site-specific recombinase XerD
MSLDLSKLTPDMAAQLEGILATMHSGVAATAKRKTRRKDELKKYLSEDQIEKLFAVIKSPRDTAIFRIIYHRGLRAAEVALLELADWNRERDRIRFSRLKGSHGGEYHLTSREVRALRGWLKVRGVEAGPLFPSRKGNGISQQMLDVLMKQYGQMAGLPSDLCHVHALKHSCATHLLNLGLSIEDVQDHLGHVNIQSTLEYAKYSTQRRAEKDKRLRDW